MTFKEKIDHLRALTVEMPRDPMSRSQQFPTMASQHIANEQEITRLREALREAVGIIDILYVPGENGP